MSEQISACHKKLKNKQNIKPRGRIMTEAHSWHKTQCTAV